MAMHTTPMHVDRDRLLVAFGMLPFVQAAVAYYGFPLFWALRAPGARLDDDVPLRMAVIVGVFGVIATGVAVPIVYWLIRRGRATLPRLLLLGILLGNVPLALYAALLIPPTAAHLLSGTLHERMVPFTELVAGVARVVALTSSFGILSAGWFWFVGVRERRSRIDAP